MGDGGGEVRKKSQVLLIAGRCLVNLLCQKWHLGGGGGGGGRGGGGVGGGAGP
jgi:hypothetical protein